MSVANANGLPCSIVKAFANSACRSASKSPNFLKHAARSSKEVFFHDLYAVFADSIARSKSALDASGTVVTV